MIVLGLFVSALLCTCALMAYVAMLRRALRFLEEREAWARHEQQWTRFLTQAAPIMETTGSVSKLIEALWPNFFAERVRQQIITVLKASLAEIPHRYNARIISIQLGSAAPKIISATTALDADGKLQALDCHIHFDCSDMVIHVEARTPLGTGTLKVHGLRLSGTIRLIPLADLNLMTFGFAYPPRVELDLQAAVGSFGAKVGNSAFLRRAIASVLSKRFTEPRRRMMALFLKPARLLHSEDAFQAATLHISLQQIIAPALACSEVLVSVQVLKVQQSGGPHPTQGPSPIGSLQLFQFELTKPNATVILKFSNLRGAELAQAVLDIKLLRDGTIAMWGLMYDGNVQATRWNPGSEPWQVDVPLELKQDRATVPAGNAPLPRSPLTQQGPEARFGALPGALGAMPPAAQRVPAEVHAVQQSTMSATQSLHSAARASARSAAAPASPQVLTAQELSFTCPPNFSPALAWPQRVTGAESRGTGQRSSTSGPAEETPRISAPSAPARVPPFMQRSTRGTLKEDDDSVSSLSSLSASSSIASDEHESRFFSVQGGLPHGLSLSQSMDLPSFDEYGMTSAFDETPHGPATASVHAWSRPGEEPGPVQRMRNAAQKLKASVKRAGGKVKRAIMMRREPRKQETADDSLAIDEPDDSRKLSGKLKKMAESIKRAGQTLKRVTWQQPSPLRPQRGAPSMSSHAPSSFLPMSPQSVASPTIAAALTPDMPASSAPESVGLWTPRRKTSFDIVRRGASTFFSSTPARRHTGQGSGRAGTNGSWDDASTEPSFTSHTKYGLPLHPMHFSCVRLQVAVANIVMLDGAQQQAQAATPSPALDGTIVVRLRQCWGVQGRQADVPISVRVLYGSQMLTSQAAAITGSGIAHFQDTFLINESGFVPGNTLLFEIRQHSRAGKKVVLSKCKLTVGRLVESRISSFDLPLAGVDAGFLSVSGGLLTAAASAPAYGLMLREMADPLLPSFCHVRIECAQDLPKFKLYKNGFPTAVRLRHGNWSGETPVAARSYQPQWQAAFMVPLDAGRPLELDLCRCSKIQGLKCFASTTICIPEEEDFHGWVELVDSTGGSAGSLHVRILIADPNQSQEGTE